MFILIVFFKIHFPNSYAYIYLVICLSLVFATYRGPLWGGLYDGSNFSIFDHPRIGLIYFSLCSFPFYLSICRFLCLYYFMLACFQLFILSSSQNKIDITVFFSLRTFVYLFTFSFHVIIIFYSIQAFVIVCFHVFFSSSFWSWIASKR